MYQEVKTVQIPEIQKNGLQSFVFGDIPSAILQMGEGWTLITKDQEARLVDAVDGFFPS